jgi:hypothetical protein
MPFADEAGSGRGPTAEGTPRASPDPFRRAKKYAAFVGL